MACLPSVAEFAYNHHDERLQLFRVETFDSGDYSKLPFLITRRSTSKRILQWHNDNNNDRRTAAIEYETNVPPNDLNLGSM